MRRRGFEIAQGWEDKDISLPVRSTANAAAYDIEAAVDVVIPPFRPGTKPTLVPTGLKAYCQPDECYYILNRSSGAGKGICLPNGVGLIDADYYGNSENDGHFYVLLINTLDHDLEIKKHDRIAQVVFHKFLLTDNDQATGVRQGGIGSTDRPRLQIIYDVDDVLWPCTETVYDKIGIDIRRQTNFRVHEDTEFSEAEQTKIIQAFSNVENFQKMKFYDGAQQIFEVEKLGAEVQINSNSFSEDIREAKRRQLLKLFPNIKVGQLQLNLVGSKTNHKQISAKVFAFVDDSPYNIASSEAKFNFMPRRPWNTTEAMRQIACGHGKVLVDNVANELGDLIKRPECYVIPVDNLNEVCNLIYQAVKLKQKGE